MHPPPMPRGPSPQSSRTSVDLSAAPSRRTTSPCSRCGGWRAEPFLSNRDLDASVAGVRNMIGWRDEKIELAGAGGPGPAAVDPVPNKSGADRRRPGERKRPISGKIAESIGVADHFDLVDRALLDVAEHCVIGGGRFRGQPVATEDEIEAKVVRQDRLGGNGVPEDH